MKNVILFLTILLSGCVCTQFDKKRSKCYYEVGMYYESIGDYKQGFFQYEASVDLNPKDTVARIAKKRMIRIMLEKKIPFWKFNTWKLENFLHKN